ncbi:MAG TPA: DUF3299 domain-containing protein [Burkholderiales bacterium]|jgi:uncharacterized protein|nr:DUF3299 domain-containing protein [Burkholderiales bacterium]
MTKILFAVLLAFAVPALAQHQTPQGADPSQFKPLPERNDVVSWKTFSQVELVKHKDRYVPQFAKDVAALDQKLVKVQGFMMPLQTGDKQTHFVLTAMPQTCSFCMPGGPESMVEVKSKTAVKYTFEPVVLTGKLAILKDDPTGVFYRLTDAVPAK